MSQLRAALPVLLATRKIAHTCAVGVRRLQDLNASEIPHTCFQLCAGVTASLLLQLELFFSPTARQHSAVVYRILFSVPSIPTGHYREVA